MAGVNGADIMWQKSMTSYNLPHHVPPSVDNLNKLKNVSAISEQTHKYLN